MAQAQFIPTAPAPSESWGQLQEIQQKTYDFKKKKDLNRIFAKNVAQQTVTDPSTGKVITRAGDIDQAGYYRDAAQAGLSPEAISEGLKQFMGQRRAESELVNLNIGQRQTGVDSPTQTRNNASVGEPAITQKPLTNDALDSWFEDMKGKATASNPTAENTGGAPGQTAESTGPSNPLVPATAPEPVKAPLTKESLFAALRPGASADGQDLGQGKIQAQPAPVTQTPTMQLPELAPQPQGQISQAPDNRTHMQAIEDSAANAPLPGAGAIPANGDYSGFFNYDNAVAQNGIEIKAGLDASLAKLGKPQGQAGINEVLDLASKSVALPGPQFTDGKYDAGKTMAANREYPAKVTAARQAAIQALATGATGGISELMAARDQGMSQLKMRNEVTEKNAAAAGANQFAQEVTKIGRDAQLPGQIDPTTFKSKDEMDAFGKQATAYAQMHQMIKNLPAGGFTDPLETINFAKNFTQAEGLGEAEGTRNLVTMLSTKDAPTRMLLANAMDKGGGAVGAAVQAVLMNYRPADLAKLSEGMKFSKDWQTHTGTGQAPTLQKYRNPGEKPEPLTPAKLGKALGAGPRVGDTKTVGGVTGVWDGTTWRRK
jgi:hypothetical protein